MDIQAYETLITTQLEELVGNIINANPRLNIAVKKGERVGDGISKFLAAFLFTLFAFYPQQW